jgi:glycosyltransferase involved in cell wall biosynthesis
LLLTAINQIRNYHPNIHLIITGEGDARNRLQSYADELGISNHIIWTGFRQDIPRILSALDIYIQTSTNEGLSLSLLEAMAARKTIITTDVGGNSEIIKHDINGWLLKNDSINEIVNATIYLIDHPEVRARLSTTGFEYVNDNFSLNSMVAGYRHLYKQILTENILNDRAVKYSNDLSS